MDPLSIVASAAGTIGFALRTSRSLYELIDGIIDAPRDIFAVSSEVKAFTSVLASLQAHIHDGTVREEAASSLEVPLDNCINTLTSMTAKIQPYVKITGDAKKSKWRGFAWTFKKDEIRNLSERLAQNKMTLIFAIDLMNTIKLDASSAAVGTHFNQLRLELRARDSGKVMLASVSGRRGSDSHETDAGFAVRRYLQTESVIGSDIDAIPRVPSDYDGSINQDESNEDEAVDDDASGQTTPPAEPPAEATRQQNSAGPAPEAEVVANRFYSSPIPSPENTDLDQLVGGVQSQASQQKLPGQEGGEQLRKIEHLASKYERQGRFNEAEKLLLQVIEAKKRMLGPEHPDSLASMSKLGWIFYSQGHLKDAEELEAQVIKTQTSVLGPEHPDTLRSMHYLAVTYEKQTRLKEAEELGLQVMRIRKRLLGPEHPDTLSSMANLAITYEEQNRLKEAEELGLQVMETSKRVLGPEHLTTLTSMNNVAFFWKHQGRHDEALHLMTECVTLRGKTLGQNHPDTRKSQKTLRRWRRE